MKVGEANNIPAIGSGSAGFINDDNATNATSLTVNGHVCIDYGVYNMKAHKEKAEY